MMKGSVRKGPVSCLKQSCLPLLLTGLVLMGTTYIIGNHLAPLERMKSELTKRDFSGHITVTSGPIQGSIQEEAQKDDLSITTTAKTQNTSALDMAINDYGTESAYDSNTESTPRSLVVLTMSSYHYRDITQNWLRSIATLHISPNITIITADEETQRELSTDPSINVVYSNEIEHLMNTNWTSGYRSFVYSRYKYILHSLYRNEDVLISDVDTVWLENPFPYMADVDSDMILQWNPQDHLCPGFAFYRATQNTIHFVTKLIKWLQTGETDTILMNKLINERVVPGLRHDIFEPHKFVSGHNYFDEDWRAVHPNIKPVIVHSDGINTFSRDTARWHDLKVELLKEHGLWFFKD